MMPLIELKTHDWNQGFTNEQQSNAIQALENGKIVSFPQLGFELHPAEQVFLTPDFANLKSKNVSYDSHAKQLRGLKETITNEAALKDMMDRFAQYAYNLMLTLFPHYKSTLEIGRTSYRPVEIEGRIPKSYRKDDTRLHVDAFPSTPMHGKRILRFFANINPNGRDRVWRIGEPFEQVAKTFLPSIPRPWPGRAAILNFLQITRSYCTEYDYLMLQLHHHMKADLDYQKNVTQHQLSFSPNTCWLVATDQASHAAMKGQHVLEQTFYLPHTGMLTPDTSPLKILEKLMKRALI